MYVVIMAGGGGTRLWPLSTPDRPKPFIPLLGDETLFQLTVRRVLDGGELSLSRADVAVVTDRRYEDLVRAQAPGITVVAEPAGRNTAAAIALATLALERDDDEVMAVLPADQTIVREGVFRRVLAAAARVARDGLPGIAAPLVTLGIEPDRPATEYGYLLPRLDRPVELDGLTTYPLEAFQEKPDAGRARELVATTGVAWNAGMFLWRRRTIREALATFAPEILDPIASGLATGRLAEVYPSIRSTSIDYAVMEPAAGDGRVAMASLDAGWNDLGSWGSLLGALGTAAGADGRVVKPGEDGVAGPDDLVVRRRDGRLVVSAGPLDGILDTDGPSAILSGVRAGRSAVDALIERVGRAEEAART